MAYQDNIPQRFHTQTNSSGSPSSQIPPRTQSQAHSHLSSATHPGTQQGQTSLRRTPSYQSGDDAGYFHQYQSTTDGSDMPADPSNRGGDYSSYGGGGSQRAHGSIHSFSVGSSQRSVMSQASSHGSAMSGYQHQYQPTSANSPGQPVYNPQAFAQPSPPVTSQSRYTLQSPSTTHVPQYGLAQYNPAAYQSPAGSHRSPESSPIPQWPTPQTPHPHGHSPQSQHPSLIPQPTHPPPPPPPKLHESSYGSYPSPQHPNFSPHASLRYSPSVSQGLVPSPAPLSPRHSSLPPLPSSTSSASSHTVTNHPYQNQSQIYPGASRYQHTLPNPSLATDSHDSAPPSSYREVSPYGNRPEPLSISPPASNSAPQPPLHQTLPPSPRRTDTLSRHPHARPLPGLPTEETSLNDANFPPGGGMGNGLNYEDIRREVDAVVGVPASTHRRSSRANNPIHPQPPIEEADEVPSASPNGSRVSPDFRHSHTNGLQLFTPDDTEHAADYLSRSDESDAQATAGLAAMQNDEEQESRQGRRSTQSSLTSPFSMQYLQPPPVPETIESGSDSDYRGVDMASYGGGFMGYGGDSLNFGHYEPDSSNDHLAPTSESNRSSHQSVEDQGNNSEYEYPGDDDSIHPFPMARVDNFGTGGLSEPSLNRRRSYEDGDEESLSARTIPPQSLNPTPEEAEPLDLFFHPEPTLRPLPPPPVNTNLTSYLIPAGTYPTADQGHPTYGDYTQPHYPATPEGYVQAHAASATVPRSTSFTGHTTTPRTDIIIRSKTDADKVKPKLPYDSSSAAIPPQLDLPIIPAEKRKKFNPAKLSTEQFRKCIEPWALSAVLAWVKDLSEDEPDLKEQAIIDAIVALFTHKVPTMNTADAETLGARVVQDMFENRALIRDEEWVKYGTESVSGVLWQITGQGCYSSRLHVVETEPFGRCYAHLCMRTLKKISLPAPGQEKKAEDWATFYKIGKEIFDTHSKKEIERQNNLHEIVTTEDSFLSQLEILRTLYRDRLATAQPSIISPKLRARFLSDVFGRVDDIKRVNENFLLAQLKYRQREQGPFIVGFSDIFREWIRKARTAYIEYAATFPRADYLVRREEEFNLLFRQFLKNARENKLSNRLNWDTFLKSPITRIQRYTLLLTTVQKNMVGDSAEKANLDQAIEEIRLVALECDHKVGEMTKKVKLEELNKRLTLRPGMDDIVKLNLTHLGREIIYQGDLQRPKTGRFNWVDTRAFLFDHYLVLSKPVVHKESGRAVKYDVSKLPIPMDLLILESSNDNPVVKSTVRGITAVDPAGGPSGAPGLLANPANPAGAGTAAGVVMNTVLEPSAKDDKILYPFKIRHLGKKDDLYILYANTAESRRQWCEKIIEAKTKHAASLYAQNAEPFRVRVLSDSAFAYPETGVTSKSVMIKGTPLDRAIQEVEQKYSNSLSRPLPICRAAVNCATVFNQPNGRKMCAIGTDYGVYISDYNDPRGWAKAISMIKISQIAVFEEFNLFLLIADKSLIAYHLDAICPERGGATQSDSQRRAPQKLSGNREVGFFAAGRMKDRALVFYKKRDGISSTFKVLEPVLQKTSTSRSRFLRGGRTDFFREFDEFYIPADSYTINLFHSSLAISTSRGVEVLTLDKKQPWSVPNLRSDSVDAQADLTRTGDRIKDLRPLGMFRLSEHEFLVTFEECAVYVNKYGDVSRSVVMEFVGKAHSACLYGKFLILLHDNFVEVRNALNGRLRQVLAGKNVSLLDDGGNCTKTSANWAQSSLSPLTSNFNDAASASASTMNGLGLSSGLSTVPRTVKIAMQHPEHERIQLVIELVENEGQKE